MDGISDYMYYPLSLSYTFYNTKHIFGILLVGIGVLSTLLELLDRGIKTTWVRIYGNKK